SVRLQSTRLVPLVKARILEPITAWAHASHALEVPREMSLVEVTEFLRQRGQVHIGADTESRQRILKAEHRVNHFGETPSARWQISWTERTESLSAWASPDTETITRSFSASPTISRAFNEMASCLGACASR